MLKLSEIGGRHITNSMEVHKKDIFLHHLASETNPELAVRINTSGVHFDMVLLFALIWAVPRVKSEKRMKIFLLGFAIVFVLHLFKIFVFVKHDYAQHIEADGLPYWSPFRTEGLLLSERFYLVDCEPDLSGSDLELALS